MGKASNSKAKNIIIACGGTGGHLFPGIAVAEELQRQGHKVKLLISKKKVDAQASEKYGNLEFDVVPAIAKPRTLSLKMLPFLWRLWKTVSQCKKMHKTFGTDVVLGMGGFTSLAPVLAGKKVGARAYVHDSNALPGKANRMTARWCDKVFVGTAAATKFFDTEKVVVTGTPVRTELKGLPTVPTREEAAASIGARVDLKTILVMGGSQGAKQLNSLIVEASQAMPEVQFVHITGKNDYERVQGLVGDAKHHHLLSFCADMASVYAMSDLVVMRSGSSSLCEVAYAGLASLLVPYPYAADDHQTKNAEEFEEVGAAVLIQEKELDAGRLVAQISQIIDNVETLENMSCNAASLSVRDSAQQIVKELVK